MGYKRIILLADGTGKSDAALWRTNVWRLLDYIDRRDGNQVAFYNRGIGTARTIFSLVFGRAFGIGLPHDVLTFYKFLCQNYQPGDEIFCFGFSRGAYTIRAVIDLVLSQGLVQSEISDVKINRKVGAAYRAYRAETFHSSLGLERLIRWLRDALLLLLFSPHYARENNTNVPIIRFVGLWDTVGAYGVPLQGFARSISRLVWPFQLANDEEVGSPKVARVCHALSLDDERRSFHPILWNEEHEPDVSKTLGRRFLRDERISQVWFAGEHSNLGGGNPDDSLAQIPLSWIMTEAAACGLKFKEEPDFIPGAVFQTKAAEDYDGRLYYSRLGNGSFYRYAPRNVSEFYRLFSPDNKPKIHESVFKRINGRQRYAPIGIPSNYELVRANGEILSLAENPHETPVQAARRAMAQNRIWDKVYLRVVVYYLTIFAYLNLLFFPLLHDLHRGAEYSAFKPFSEFFLFVGSFLPTAATPWVRAYAGNPLSTMFSILAVAILSSAGPKLEAQIKDQMRAIWWIGVVDNKRRDRLRYLRSVFLILGKLNQKMIIPALTMTLVIISCWVAFAFLNGFLFSLRDASGAFCHRTESASLAPAEASIEFDLADFCKPTGILLEQNHRYRLLVQKIGPWQDGPIKLNLGRFRVSDLSWQARVVMSLLSVFKRTYQRPFFAIIARIGEIGTYEEFLDPDVDQVSEVISENLRPYRTGELFFYVNDAVLAFPGVEDVFYKNNVGKAKVTIRRVD